jgi:hypothetical protein
LQIIIDHFNKFPLVSAKRSDFLLFSECFELIKKGEHLTEKGLSKIIALKTFLNLGLSDKLKEAFPNTIPIDRPEYVFKGIPNPFWVSGFVSGDGSFYLTVKNFKDKLTEKIYSKVGLNFKICLHIRDKALIIGLLKFFLPLEFEINDTEETNNSKIRHIYITENTVTLHITKFSVINNIIIPFFDNYYILGYKSLDFLDFKNVSEMVNNKMHLTSEGFKLIEDINLKMNQRR